MNKIAHNYIDRLFGTNFQKNSIIGISQIAQDNYKIFMEEKTNKTTLKELEDYLNYVYYGKGKNNNETRTSHTNFEAAVENQMDELIDKYNPGSAGGKIKVSSSREKFSHQSYIQMETLQKRLNAIQEKLSSPQINKAKYLKTKTELIALENEITNLLNRAYDEWGISQYGRIMIKDKSTRDIIENIDNLWNELTYVNDAIPMSALGKAFETSLTVADLMMDSQINYNTTDLINMFHSVSTQGDKKVQNNTGLYIDGYEITPQVVEKDDKTLTVYRIEGQSGSYIDINVQAIDHYNQKMDVLYAFPDEDRKDLRVSAKSWSTLNSIHNLGKGDLLDILLRVTGTVDMPLAFGLQAKYCNDNGYNVSYLHEWAKKVAILDIAAGIGQRNGYADTLIIQDKAAQYIHVYDIAGIVQSVLNNTSSDFYLKGYEEGKIENSDKLKFHKHLNNQNYIYVVLADIQGQNISISHR